MQEDQKVEIEAEIDGPAAEEVEELAEETQESQEAPEQAEQEKTEEDLDKITFDERQQAKVDEIIGEKIAKQKQAEREAQQLREQLADLKANEAPKERPNVPDMPDRDDPDYDDRLKERDKAIADAASFDAAERMRSEQELRQKEQSRQKQMQQFSEAANKYLDRAKTLKISEDQLNTAGDRLQGFNFGPDAMAQIINDPMGPQIYVNLANDLQEADKLAGMTSYQKAIHIENVLKPKAEASIKRAKTPPPPPDHLNGKGQPEGEIGPSGATYE